MPVRMSYLLFACLITTWALIGCGPGAGDPDAPVENPPSQTDIDAASPSSN